VLILGLAAGRGLPQVGACRGKPLRKTDVIDSRGRVRQKHIGPENWASENLIASVRALL